ncbi:MAG: hypothetical protein IJ088_15065 [Clostridia bacterium]|nr:hypothetical protein [Clostridia bacterium]
MAIIRKTQPAVLRRLGTGSGQMAAMDERVRRKENRMQPGEVDYCLEHYRENVARCDFLKTEIENLQRMIRELKSMEIENSISVTQKWTGMPHGSDVADPTGILAQRVADGDTPGYLREIENELAQKQAEYWGRSNMIAYVNAWRLVLGERERFVVKMQCLEGASWRTVTAGFQERFGDIYSTQGLRKIRQRAFGKIYEIAK